MIYCHQWAVGCCVTLVLACAGCSQTDTEQAISDAETQAEQATETMAKNVGEAVRKGEQMATDAEQKVKDVGQQALNEAKQAGEEATDKVRELGDQALAYLTPLKEKFSKLDGLKEKPEDLKKAVTELIQSIEEKATDIALPDVISKALETAKEKLIALREYLKGEVEQAKIDEHLKEISDAVKHSLGMTKE